MYLCICNALKESHLSSALSSGACSVGDAFRCLNLSPVCGKCVPEIRERICGEQGQKPGA